MNLPSNEFPVHFSQNSSFYGPFSPLGVPTWPPVGSPRTSSGTRWPLQRGCIARRKPQGSRLAARADPGGLLSAGSPATLAFSDFRIDFG